MLETTDEENDENDKNDKNDRICWDGCHLDQGSTIESSKVMHPRSTKVNQGVNQVNLNYFTAPSYSYDREAEGQDTKNNNDYSLSFASLFNLRG